MENHIVNLNPIYENNDELSYIYAYPLGKRIRQIQVVQFGFFDKWQAVYIYYDDNTFDKIHLSPGLLFAYGVNYPLKNFTLELPVGAFAKSHGTEIHSLSSKVDNSHFFLIKQMLIQNFEVYYNLVTKLAVAIVISGEIDYSSFGKLFLPAGEQLSGINRVRFIVTPNYRSDKNIQESWKKGMALIHKDKRINLFSNPRSEMLKCPECYGANKNISKFCEYCGSMISN